MLIAARGSEAPAGRILEIVHTVACITPWQYIKYRGVQKVKVIGKLDSGSLAKLCLYAKQVY